MCLQPAPETLSQRFRLFDAIYMRKIIPEFWGSIFEGSGSGLGLVFLLVFVVKVLTWYVDSGSTKKQNKKIILQKNISKNNK